jgi:hypothetical protein
MPPLDMHVLVNPISRRRMLAAVGGMAACGLPGSARAVQPAEGDRLFGRAKSVILLWLSGGPPQHETFDPKPHAPLEIRGPFKPISTNVPGIRFCELLPRIARMADKLAVVRSLFTNNNIHGGSGYWVLTGRELAAGDGENARPDDWPFMGSIVKLLRPSEKLPALTSVTLPEIFVGNGGNLHAGQFGGFLGSQWNPEIITCNPADPKLFSKDSKELSGDYASRVPASQLQRRAALLRQVEGAFGQGGAKKPLAGSRPALWAYDQLQRQALDLLSSSGACRAFSLEDESPRIRDRYGRQHWGQSVLLARRLVEAGVRFVTVNWPRVPGDRGVDNPLWDTHARNFDRMEDVLAPQFDVGFTALLEDLDQRGLLAETLVVAVGEFGRTPKVNANAGRDHWGGVFCAVLAGAGISGGQVLGASDKQGAYPAQDPVNAGHLTATIFHLLGIDPQGTFRDRSGRELRVTDAEPLFKLLGEGPATRDRTQPTGDIARIPAFTSAPLVEPDFAAGVPMRPVDAPANPKGWRAAPILTERDQPGFGVSMFPKRQQAAIGILGAPGDAAAAKWRLEAGSQAILAQQIRDPQAGRFIVTLAAQGDGSSKAFYDEVFQKNFRCRLMIFQYTEPAKDPQQRRELATLEIRPAFRGDASSKCETFVLEKFLGNPGANFSFGLGIGTAVIVERASGGALELPRHAQAFVSINRVDVKFEGQVG